MRYGLEIADADGTLRLVGATYSAESDAIYDGTSRSGVRIVNFSPILKHKLFPLPEIVSRILELGASGISSAVEIEFAANISAPLGQEKEFAVVQLRPLVVSRELSELEIEDHERDDLICQTTEVLGVGRVDDLRDIVVVDVDRFDRGQSQAVAEEVAWFNARLFKDNVPYLLIGVGRWGSADPWLGIPVTWEQICGAKVIVEAGFKDFKVTPSQGAHFHQNITALRIGYFTVNPDNDESFLDWQWLAERPSIEERRFVRHLRLEDPLLVLVNGHRHKGVILKPR
jgi:hypothetical protein